MGGCEPGEDVEGSAPCPADFGLSCDLAYQGVLWFGH